MILTADIGSRDLLGRGEAVLGVRAAVLRGLARSLAVARHQRISQMDQPIGGLIGGYAKCGDY